MDDTVRSLIRLVARDFYLTPYALIVDAVILHSVLSEDDLIYLLGIKRKELRSLCNRLVEDRLLVNHIQKEESGQQQRLITRTYFFIHVTEAIDSIKWKVHSIVNQLKEEMQHYGNPQGYVCPRCGKKVSQLDAISLLSDDRTSFVCDVCHGILVEDDSSHQAQLRQVKLERLMTQVDPIISHLKKIDDANIEDNDFESALVKSIPAQLASLASYTLSNRIDSRSRSNMSSSLQNAATKAQATLHVSITANDENYEREQEEKEKRRVRLEQNALPSWHSNSTVGESGLGEVGDDEGLEGPGIKLDASNVKSEPAKIDEVEAKPGFSEPTVPAVLLEIKDKEQQDALAAYYAKLAEADDNDDDDDDDDDEDEFDDVL